MCLEASLGYVRRKKMLRFWNWDLRQGTFIVFAGFQEGNFLFDIQIHYWAEGVQNFRLLFLEIMVPNLHITQSSTNLNTP